MSRFVSSEQLGSLILYLNISNFRTARKVIAINALSSNLWYTDENREGGVPMIPVDEKTKRLEAVEYANAINAIEGVHVSKETSHLLSQWVNGDISLETAREQVLARYRRKVV